MQPSACAAPGRLACPAAWALHAAVGSSEHRLVGTCPAGGGAASGSQLHVWRHACAWGAKGQPPTPVLALGPGSCQGFPTGVVFFNLNPKTL
jgi:hypothetical protein